MINIVIESLKNYIKNGKVCTNKKCNNFKERFSLPKENKLKELVGAEVNH